MKHVRCNFCDADDAVILHHGPDLLLQKPGDFYLVRCRQCGLIYQNPQLSMAELANHYPDDYLPYQQNATNQQTRMVQVSRDQAIARFCDRVIQHRPQPGHLLDVGCATGSFLWAMQQRGWQVKGVEPIKHAAVQAQQDFGLEVFVGLLQEAAYPEATFDVVTLWDVLEHVADAQATLQEVHRILKPGGLLVFSVPNPSCIEARLFGRNWVGWERPRHLTLIPPRLVPAYLQKARLELEGIESFNGRLRLTLYSVEFMLKARGVPEHKWRRWLDLAYTIPFRLATWPMYKLGEHFNQTSIMTVFAKRPYHL
ncbi:MAG: class I SAM-dependent methyltransferase [Ardenticatenaceae bacterium]|nr:class I SAM-dependent methyltransferase [Ardenticatenaceae bacterium]